MGTTHSSAKKRGRRRRTKKQAVRARLTKRQKAAIGAAGGVSASSLAYLLHAAYRRRKAQEKIRTVEPRETAPGTERRGEKEEEEELAQGNRSAQVPEQEEPAEDGVSRKPKNDRETQRAKILKKRRRKLKQQIKMRRNDAEETRVTLSSLETRQDTDVRKTHQKARNELMEKKKDINKWFSPAAVKLRYDLLKYEDKVELFKILEDTSCLYDFRVCEERFQSERAWQIYLQVIGNLSEGDLKYRATRRDKQDGLRTLHFHIGAQAEQALQSMSRAKQKWLMEYNSRLVDSRKSEKIKESHWKTLFRRGDSEKNIKPYFKLISFLLRYMMGVPKGCEMTRYQFNVALNVLDRT